MTRVTRPRITQLATGEKFNAKQMEARAGELLPRHIATIESVLVVLQGECVLALAGTDHVLKEGDSFVVPPDIEHQIRAIRDFRAVHVMTNDIEFIFLD